MELHFVSIYRVHGISKLPGDERRQVWQSKAAKAYLTTNLDEFAYHPDRASAVIHGLMSTLFAEGQPGSVEERLTAGADAIRQERSKKHPNAVFFVFHGIRKVGPVTADVKRDSETFTLAFDAIDKKAVYNEYLQNLLSALAAVVLGLDFQADASVSKVLETSYLIDPSTFRPTYSVTMTALPARLSLAKVPDEAVFERIDRNAKALKARSKVSRVLDQFIQSLGGDFDDFRSFLAAWNALEIFVSSSFKGTYSKRWFSDLQAAAPPSAAEYFDRLREIMSERHRLTDKFVVLASLLNPTSAETDIIEFKGLKARRDAISHGTDDAAQPYPIVQTQQLLRKYLSLHLAEQPT